MRMMKRRRRQVPDLNTAALPDLIFTVLLFFMIVTHLRDVELKVKYSVPQGTELTKLTKKAAVTHIYIGKAATGTAMNGSDSVFIQINDKLVGISEITGQIEAERNRMAPEDFERMTIDLRADRDIPMHIITEVKEALRSAYALRVFYSASEAEERRQ